jgi:pyruvate-ferredoxin/flavodoxin oxidoreductase
MMQAIKTIKEAEEHNGPAIIIAYSPCIEHGITGGMSNSINEEKLAVESGYVLLMRYYNNELHLDFKNPDFNKYEEFLSNEVRYNALKIKDKKIAEELLNLNKTNAIERYNYYQNISIK